MVVARLATAGGGWTCLVSGLVGGGILGALEASGLPKAAAVTAERAADDGLSALMW